MQVIPLFTNRTTTDTAGSPTYTAINPAFVGLRPNSGTSYHIEIERPASSTSTAWTVTYRFMLRLSPDAPWYYPAAATTVTEATVGLAVTYSNFDSTPMACAEAAVEVTTNTASGGNSGKQQVSVWMGM